MELTRRQEKFIHLFVDLYREMHKPIHYSLLAKKIGVSSFTAYDMLRLLEKKGYVTSKYQINSNKPSVGRSEIVFTPTSLAYSRFPEEMPDTKTENPNPDETEIAEKVQPNQIIQDHALSEIVLNQISIDTPDNLRFCLNVLTDLIIGLKSCSSCRFLLKWISQFVGKKGIINTRSGLLFFGGFIFGMVTRERIIDLDNDRSIVPYMERYRSVIMEMDPQLCQQLGKDINEMFNFIIKSELI